MIYPFQYVVFDIFAYILIPIFKSFFFFMNFVILNACLKVLIHVSDKIFT